MKVKVMEGSCPNVAALIFNRLMVIDGVEPELVSENLPPVFVSILDDSNKVMVTPVRVVREDTAMSADEALSWMEEWHRERVANKHNEQLQ